jgi:hypothetical protein
MQIFGSDSKKDKNRGVGVKTFPFGLALWGAVAAREKIKIGQTAMIVRSGAELNIFLWLILAARKYGKSIRS